MKCSSQVIFVFIDGIGLGLKDSFTNPFTRFNSHFFSPLGGKSSFPEKGVLLETDAHMTISGLPQSATGQTALFTGYNGPKIMNRHINGFPTYTLRPYLKEKSLLPLAINNGLKATLLNSYSQMYLNRLKKKRSERLMSATSIMQSSSGLPFFTIDDYKNGKSMYMDITNWLLKRFDSSIELQTPQAAGRNLVRISQNYDLSIYEYFLTDKVGHKQSMGAARRVIPHIEGLLEGIWQELDTKKTTFILSSDHGNLEDLSVKTHTNNKVPTIIYGVKQQEFANQIKSLYDIPRAILKHFNIHASFDDLLLTQ